jgi:hypothetical protein
MAGRLLVLNLVVLLPIFWYVSSFELYSIKDTRHYESWHVSSLQQIGCFTGDIFLVLCKIYGDEWDHLQDLSGY